MILAAANIKGELRCMSRGRLPGDVLGESRAQSLRAERYMPDDYSWQSVVC